MPKRENNSIPITARNPNHQKPANDGRTGPSASQTRRNTSAIHTPTPAKMTRVVNKGMGGNGKDKLKNQLIGTLASIAHAPKHTVTLAARRVEYTLSFEPQALLKM